MANTLKHATDVVNSLYTNGSDMRQQKNGATGKVKLVEKIMKDYPITTCGIYALLDRKDQMIIDEKKEGRLAREYPEFRKRIANILLRYANTHSPKIFCKVTEQGMDVLKAIVEGRECIYSKKTLDYVFDVRRMFDNQERKKVLARG